MQIKLINSLFYTRKELIKLMIRTFIFLFCTTLFSLTPKRVASQNDKIVIDADQVISVDGIFRIVKKQTDYMFVYHLDLFKNFPKVELKKGVIRLDRLLSEILSVGGINVIFTINNTILIKEKINNTKVQQRKVSGTVKDQLGIPIPGATVLIKGTSKGVATNLDGQYSITVPDPSNVLVFRFLGFEPQEIMVGNQITINISLKDSISKLDEVTIEAGYYKTSQRKATGNISKIEAKDIEKQPVNNPLAAIQGRMSGVDITQTTGLSGGNYIFRIRGQNFIDPAGALSSSNTPLYIVDGVPYSSESLENGSSLAPNILPGGRVNPLNVINPADIQSIEVLKDADATAIYGSRGASGVVLITTKKGKEGKTQVKVNVSTTLGEVTGFMDLLNTQQFLEVRKEALANDGYDPSIVRNDFPDLFEWDQERYTDWQEVLLGGTAYRQNAQISFSGGNEYTQFLFSGGYLSETTVFPGDSKYDKVSVRVNINHESEDRRLKLNVSAVYSSDTNNLPTTDLTNSARILAPNAPELYDDAGNLNWENGTWDNPLAILESKYKAVTRNLIGNAMLSYHPFSALEFKTNLGYTEYGLASYSAKPHTMYDPNDYVNYNSSESSISTNAGSRQSWIVEPQINWQQHWENASLALLIGATFQQNKDEQLGLRGRGFPSNNLIFDLVSADTRFITQDTASEYKYHAVFGRINFNWQDKYILNLTGRRDGSSRFGPGKQFGNFGAVGAAWLFTEENFLVDSNILSYGKFRASFGITGSDSVGDYKFLDTYSTNGGDFYDGSGLKPTGLFNPNYSWEETEKLETALELGFFKDHITLTAAWYRNRSSNQLIDTPLPSTTGFGGINTNVNAVVQNTGFEMDLSSRIINNDKFKWRTTFNISVNKNKLLEFPNLNSSTFRTTRLIGESLNAVRLYHFIGVDSETGVYQFEDYNNDGEIDRNDVNWIENRDPKYFGGLGNTFEYKNLKLDVFFQFKKQKDIRSDLRSFVFPGFRAENFPVSELDRWQQPGDQNPIQRYFVNNIPEIVDAVNKYRSSNAIMADASFIRLRNVSLSYTLPKAVTNGLDLNIYLQGQNLFIITPYDGTDPEVKAIQTLPPLRQFTLGFNLSF